MLNTNLHNLDTQPLDDFAAGWDRWVATCRGEVVPPVTVLDTMERMSVLSLDIAGGVQRQVILYPHQANASEPVELLGRCEAYAVGDVAVEMDDNVDFFRRVGIIIGEQFNHTFTATELLRIAELLRNDTVYAALQRWAAEDAAAENV